MDMNKEKEAFDAWWDESGDLKNNGPWEKDTPIQFAWEAWQAAKSSAVPDGFVLVNKASLARVLNCVTDDWLIDTGAMDEFNSIENLVLDEVKTMIEAAQEVS